ncbi:MAG: CARDB domain-containing protein [Solirubrobacterales bacterium]
MAKAPAPVDFFDEDDEQAERPERRAERSVSPPEGRTARASRGAPRGARGGGGGGTHSGPPANRQQARVRQVVFLLGAIVMLILVVIAIRGCLNARKDRSFKNYVSDLSSITVTEKQISDQLFDILDGGNGNQAAEDIGLQNEVQSAAGSAQDLLDRAQDLNAPSELDGAQQQIALAFELRHDALEGIAAQVGKTGGSNAGKAEQAIYTQMKVLSASDILYARAQDQIEDELANQGITIDEGVPSSRFLPEDPNYLDPAVTKAAVSGAGVGTGGTSNADCENDGQTHGVGLVDGGATLQPSGTALIAGGSVTASADDDSIDVQVQNQGEADESGVEVKVSGDGVSGQDTIDSIAAGATETASVPIKATAGQTVEITVEVTPVPCEQVEENNTATYSVTF